MRGLEVDAAVVELVVLDDDEAGDGGEQRDVVERRVGVGALFLLLGGVRGLQDEDALDEEEEGGGVEELESTSAGVMGELRMGMAQSYRMCREEHQVIAEDAAPDYRCQLRTILSAYHRYTSPVSSGCRLTIQAPACATAPVPVSSVRIAILEVASKAV